MTAFIIFFSIITPADNYNSILKSTKMKKYRNLTSVYFFTFLGKFVHDLIVGLLYFILMNIFKSSYTFPYRHRYDFFDISTVCQSLYTKIVKCHYQFHHKMLLFKGSVCINLMEGILMKEIFPYGSCRFHLKPVRRRKGIHTNHLYDFFKF